MKKNFLSLGIVTAIIIGQSVTAFASDNKCLSKYNIDIEKVKANAITTVISNPTTIVNYNGTEYHKDSKNLIEEEYNIDYNNVDAVVVDTIIVSPKTVVDIDVPLANEFTPACFDKLNK